MPTFTSIALENLLEPRLRDSHQKPLSSEQITISPRGTNGGTAKDEAGLEGAENTKHQPLNHYCISPALYITSDPTPIPDASSGSVSPSPYVANRKRRSGGNMANRKIDEFDDSERKEGEKDDEQNESTFQVRDTMEAEAMEDLVFGTPEVSADRIKGLELRDGVYLNPKCDVLLVGSANETVELDSQSFASTQGDFFDANEVLFSDFSDESASSVSSYIVTMESELRTTRLQLLQEIEKRKDAENTLNMMSCQWQRISNILSEAGLKLPSPSSVIGGMEPDPNSIEDILQEIIVARFVSQAVGKGQARAEVELAVEAIIESKSQEISRLRDRLMYYETANREMSERNQEILDTARKQHQRQMTQQKLWSCVGLSAVVGISVAAYFYLSKPGHHQLTSRSGHSTAGDV
ncbi:unnamed protein product [Cuscuta epithymum]|uniref:Uncharacterized protein n=1 Tax=Cuscuta epithymum TaxID=186058 RepID=A0AAV0FLI4_9ASTE|nr:unnamed protein product [Cuscuta epithymum]